MQIDLPDQAPPPPAAVVKLPKRPAPCAGLFGWRKDGVSKFDANAGAAPGRDFPAG